MSNENPTDNEICDAINEYFERPKPKDRKRTNPELNDLDTGDSNWALGAVLIMLLIFTISFVES